MAPTILTRSVARRAKRQRDIGYLFPLIHTRGLWQDDDPDLPSPELVGTPKAHARIKKIPLASLAMATGLSPTMHAEALAIFDELQANPDDPIVALGGLARGLERQQLLYDALCILGFVEPRLVETEAEADLANDERIVWIEEIDPRDRQRFGEMVTGGEEAAAAMLRPFPADGLEDPDPDRALSASAPTLGDPPFTRRVAALS